jgi:Polyketide cyclase / dehydrase and lipid transport.
MYFRYSLETDAAPEQAFRAFTDFSDRRLDVWRGTLDPKKYELREHGDTWAVAKEGSAGTKVWVLLRYEWREPGIIHWSVLDSDHCDSGIGDITIVARPGGGSTVHVVIDHTDPRGLRGRAILLMQRLLGPIAFPRLWKSALDRQAGTNP